MMNKKGFTLIEMLTTTAILVIVFGLLAIIFGRATTIHKVVRSGGDAENLGIYLINTISYGPGINREKGLVGAQPFAYVTPLSSTVLRFKDTNGNDVTYTLGDAKDGTGVVLDKNTLCFGSLTLTCPPGVNLKPSWATDRQLEVLPDSGFHYYDKDGMEIPASPYDPTVYIYAVEIRLVLKNTLQNDQEKVTLSRYVRVRNQIDF